MRPVLATLLALGAASAVLTACEPAASRGPAASRAEVEAALRRYEAFTLAMAGDSLAACFTPDGELLREDGGVLRGPAAIGAFLRSFTGVHVDSVSMTSDTIQLAEPEAAQWGTFAQVVRVEGHGVIHARGRFVMQWSRGADGRWRIRRVMTQSFPRAGN
ncbi:MAG TPA: SgcJ/EcaC family oxidoreductase [Candidatus Acidoferrales bacterium]|nr:SgcJ/EcaC family oxidoreductase [Candidatus Acidoferrales bacterium]